MGRTTANINVKTNLNMRRIYKHQIVIPVLLGLASGPALTAAADAQRQAEVAQRGAEVMPFNLAATQHVFTKTAQGGRQRVVATRATDSEQIRLVRGHLRDIQHQFLASDFSGPAHIHGQAMPGLAELNAAPKGKLRIDFREVPAGAELSYSTSDPALVEALHQWFDAQLSDHGTDAMAGHPHHHGASTKP
jgi:hypothetical protein